jgi:hypothetical protein
MTNAVMVRGDYRVGYLTIIAVDLTRFGGSPENLMNGVQARAE